MKIRSNYVSNSSSSSYIIGVALIKDECLDKIKKFASDFNLTIVEGDDEDIKETSFNEDEVRINVPKGKYALKFWDCVDCPTNEDGEPIPN